MLEVGGSCLAVTHMKYGVYSHSIVCLLVLPFSARPVFLSFFLSTSLLHSFTLQNFCLLLKGLSDDVIFPPLKNKRTDRHLMAVHLSETVDMKISFSSFIAHLYGCCLLADL